MKKTFKIILIIFVSIVGLLLLLSLFAGPIAKRYIEKHSKELCHRTVTIDKIRINLFVGAVGIYGLDALEENDKESFLSFESLKVNANVWALLGKKVVLTKIALNTPKIMVIQDGSRFNFTDILEFYDTDEEDEDTTSSGWIVDLRKISLAGGNITYQDPEIGSKFNLNDLAITIPQLYFSDKDSDVGLKFSFSNGGNIDIQMKYGLKKQHYHIALDLNNFDIDAIKPYLDQSFNIDDLSGKLSAKLSVTGDLDHITHLTTNGSVNLKEFAIHSEKNKIASLSNIDIIIKEIDLTKNRIDIEKIAIDGLDFNYQLTKNSNTLSLLTKNREESDSSDNKTNGIDKENSANKTSDKFDFQVNHFSVKNSSFTFSDYSLKQGSFTLPINHININANNLTLGKKSQVSLSATLGKSGELTGDWLYMPHSNIADQIITLNIKNFQIKEASPYSVHYFSYPITNGTLAFSSINTLKGNMLNSNNMIDIYGCKVDKKIKDLKPEHNIPLRAAVYVLTDLKGQIGIKLPVQGDISSPTFSFRKIIFKTFMNLMLKVAVSPIDFIIKACQANADVFRDFTMQYDDNLINSASYTQLNAIVDVLKSKPDITMNIQPSVNKSDFIIDKENDTEAMIQERIDENLANKQEILLNYFTKQGIDSNRISFMALKDKQTLKGKINFSFDVTMPELEDMSAEVKEL